MPDNARREFEVRSSAVTLSDMELFVFPELMYALVLANIMSPRIWRWAADPWFQGLDTMSPYKRIMRLKQFLMDRYAFNLDLDTWGLTTKERETARFSSFITAETLARSNALFGYEGDKYYFDIDIRTHFGLHKYRSNVIPYWKTETVEAMDAFVHKPGYSSGAGECVSLATLYAAAMFVVARIPMRDIFLMATPLHSQNFLDVGDGILTNNRRLVTKAMWFNGTELSAQARRALENERVTIVAHETGHVHTIYEEATISREAYERLDLRLREFLKVRFSPDIFGNFLRSAPDLQKCFQIRWPIRGVDHYTEAERVFAFERSSSFRLTDRTRDKLLGEMGAEEFQPGRLPGRLVLNELEDFVRANDIDLDSERDVARLLGCFEPGCLHKDKVMGRLLRFCHVRPSLPEARAKRFAGAGEPLGLDAAMGRDEIIRRVEARRSASASATLAFYAYRDLLRTESGPFVAAAVQRNPVSATAAADEEEGALVARVRALPEASIYEDPGRLAQPDEVWNYGRGDGAEKALLLANLLRQRRPDEDMVLHVSPDRAVLKTKDSEYSFASAKGLRGDDWPLPPARQYPAGRPEDGGST